MPENDLHSEVSLPRKSILAKVRDLFTPKSMRRDASGFSTPWDDDQVAELRTLIERSPEGIDVSAIVSETFGKLNQLLGPPHRKGVTAQNVRDRVIVTDPDLLTAFRYLFEQPGANSDKYWKNPLRRIIMTRATEDAVNLMMMRAVSYGGLGVVFIPNNSPPFDKMDPRDREYLVKNSVSPKDYPLLQIKMIIAHELTHLLYGKRMIVPRFLIEPFTDYIASCVYPEIAGLGVEYEWAKAVMTDYLTQLGYRDLYDYFQADIDQGRGAMVKRLETAIETHRKYFSTIRYEHFALPESMVEEMGLSKYLPIPS